MFGIYRKTFTLSNQQAVFVSGGKICDVFGPGQYSLSSKNLPILASFVSIPFDGESPFVCSVYFFNKSIFMSLKYGIKKFNLTDPDFKLPIPVCARGSFAVSLNDGVKFLIKCVGNLKSFTPADLSDYFSVIVSNLVKTQIISFYHARKLKPTELELVIEEVTKLAQAKLEFELDSYGIVLRHFIVEGIPVVDEDERVKSYLMKLESIYTSDMEERLRYKRHSENIDIYSKERQFDIAENAAKGLGNNGVTGTFLGLSAMGGLTKSLSEAMGNSIGGVAKTESCVCDKCGAEMPYGTKFCKKCGDEMIVCKYCKKDNPKKVKFCIYCGKSFEKKCPVCGCVEDGDAAFCGECGTKLE